MRIIQAGGFSRLHRFVHWLSKCLKYCLNRSATLAKGKAVHVVCFEISLSSLTVTSVSLRDSLVYMKTRDVIEASHLQSGKYFNC